MNADSSRETSFKNNLNIQKLKKLIHQAEEDGVLRIWVMKDESEIDFDLTTRTWLDERGYKLHFSTINGPKQYVVEWVYSERK